MIYKIEFAKLRALAPTCLTHHWYAPYASTPLLPLPIINTRLTRLRVYATVPSSIGTLHVFVLCCVVLSQLKGKVHFSSFVSPSCLLFYHIKLLYMLFFSFFYFRSLITLLFIQLFCNGNILQFQFCFSFKNLTNI